jgi:hypothetical protein
MAVLHDRGVPTDAHDKVPSWLQVGASSDDRVVVIEGVEAGPAPERR